MASFTIPEAGLALPGVQDGKDVTTNTAQAMQVDLASNVYDDIVQNTHGGEKDLHVNLGKSPVLHLLSSQ